MVSLVLLIYLFISVFKGEPDAIVENYSEDKIATSVLDFKIGSKDLNKDLDAISNLTTDSILLTHECEMDEERIVEAEYAKPPSAASRDEEIDSLEDECLGYIYSGPEFENSEGWVRLGLLQDPWAEERHLTLNMLT